MIEIALLLLALACAGLAATCVWLARRLRAQAEEQARRDAERDRRMDDAVQSFVHIAELGSFTSSSE